MKLILFDFEVYKYDTLLGAIILEEDNVDILQTWDVKQIKEFYLANKDVIWIGWNNSHYDNFMVEACLEDKNRYKLSVDIIKNEIRRRLKIQLYNYDIMSSVGFYSLKNSEALAGKKISEAEIDFDIDRPLTAKEKILIENYNLEDLDQTLDNFMAKKDAFILRLETINEFGLSLAALGYTGTMLAEKVLHAERIDGIGSWVVKPKLYENLRLKNERLLDFYLNEHFKQGEKLKIMVCGVEHTIGVGGIHAAREKYKTKNALYFDVSGYYNLIMIKYGLLPRSIPDEYKKVYTDMYFEQLKLKKTNPKKREVFKIILLSVYGGTLNEYTGFYDPYHGRLITMTGQIFLVDLLEKLEGKVELVQSNTDGIIAVPLEGVTEEEILSIIKEWETRTGFNLAIEHLSDLVQRDVNCYMYRKNGKIYAVGGDITNYSREDPFPSAKEPYIIGDGIVEYFMNNKKPEEVVYQNKMNPSLFQYIAKKMSFDRLELQEDYEDQDYSSIKIIQNVNRAFASNDKHCRRMIYKCKDNGKVKRAKVSNLPNNIFVYNEEILSDRAIKELSEQIDYQYYVDKIYDKIKEFINIPEIKGINFEKESDSDE